MRLRPLTVLWGLALLLALTSFALSGTGQARGPVSEWQEFHGTWTLSGSRHELPAEGGATAAVVEVSGAAALASDDRMSPVFLVRAIGYDDGTVSVGRSTWTDDSGDHIFTRLEGEPLAAGRRIRGTITGGTGRYAGAEGSFEFGWQYVVADEAGRIQGRAIGLAGRIRRAGSQR